MTQEQIQTIADTCHEYGYDFSVALRTARRDGEPYYRTARETYEYQRELALIALERNYSA
jgi:hypothetical protein